MEFAEGYGPKQVKKPYVLGQFVTVYGNDGTPGAVNPAATAYTPVSSGSEITLNQLWAGGVVGVLSPGLNLNVNGNGNTDTSFIFAPGAATAITDLTTAVLNLTPTTTFSGSAGISWQGSYDRYSAADVSWNVIATGIVTSGGGSLSLNQSGIGSVVYNAYRIVASGTPGAGIINWSIPGFFLDINAQSIGQNATYANGGIGQLNIQDNDRITISGGQQTGYSEDPEPLAAIKNNADYYG